MTLIFVYGTLKRGCYNHHHLAGQRFLGEARTVAGYILFLLGDYPGMVRRIGAEDDVVGEVWAVDSAALTTLDELEGVGEGLYERGPVRLLAPFADQPVQTYLYLRPLEGRPAIGPVWKE